ncbi:MAG: 16S rRNA processing protein RimM [Paludibacteraceae bacterium]|nr:16S rRNA processing protein RimM [Paludibacteraceae bacterium]
MNTIDRNDYRRAGRVLKAHGLKGDLVLELDADALDGRDCLMLDMEGLLVPFFWESWRTFGTDGVLMHLQGVDTPEQIREVAGRDVYLPKGGSEEGEEMLTYEDLIGYHVLYEGRQLGVIEDVDDQTENVLLVLSTDHGELLLPASPDYVTAVRVEDQVLEMDFPAGLLTINA